MVRWVLARASLSLVCMSCSFTQDFERADGGVSILPALDVADSGADLRRDPENCGAAGHSCLGGLCVEARCTPIALAEGQGDSSRYGLGLDGVLEGPDRIGLDETHVYWTNLRGELMRVPAGGGVTERVARLNDSPMWIAVHKRFVFVSLADGSIVRWSKADGKTARFAGPSSMTARPVNDKYPTELTLHEDALYWSGCRGVFTCPVDGCKSEPEAVYRSQPDACVYSFAIDATGHKYMAFEDVTKTGENSSTVGYAVFGLEWDEQDKRWIWLSLYLRQNFAHYELVGDSKGIAALLTAGSNEFAGVGRTAGRRAPLVLVASGILDHPRGLAVDGTHLYWANGFDPNGYARRERIANVVRCAKSGCAAPEVLAKDQVTPRAVAVSSDAVFWTTGDGKIMKIAKPVDAIAAPTP